MTRYRFLVQVDSPETITPYEMEAYIRDAVRSWKGGMNPNGRFFNLNARKFVVKPWRKPITEQVAITRKAAVQMVNKHLSHCTPQSKNCWHYGRVEIKELLDAIYGKPKGVAECL